MSNALYELEIRSPSSLLSVVLRQDITPAQASIIRLVLDSDITYGEALAIFAPWFERRPPLEGIELYQVEGR